MTEMRGTVQRLWPARGPENTERSGPRLRPGHVLVRVAASSVNRTDITARSGKLKPVTGRSFPLGVGLDFVGEIVEAADGVTGLVAGDEVWGFLDVTGGDDALPGQRQSMSWLPPKARPGVPARSALSSVGAAAIGVLRDGVRLRPGERILTGGRTAVSVPPPSRSPVPWAGELPRWPAPSTWIGSVAWAPRRHSTITPPTRAIWAVSISCGTRRQGHASLRTAAEA